MGIDKVLIRCYLHLLDRLSGQVMLIVFNSKM